MRQTKAILVDAYRELQSKKMFWVVLILNVAVVGLFAVLGVNERSLTVLWYEVGDTRGFGVEPAFLYKYAFSTLLVGQWFAWLSTLLALISVAGLFPDFMVSGGVDMYLAKPMGRLRLFLTKYLTGLLFVSLQVVLFTVLSFLVLGIRGHMWEAGLFWAIPIVMVFFSYLFGVCVLMGTLTRSTIAAFLMTMLFWGGLWIVNWVDESVTMAPMIAQMEQNDLTRRLDNNARQIETETKAQNPNSEKRLADLQAERTRLLRRRETSITPEGVKTVQDVLVWIKQVMPKTHDTIALLDRVLFKDVELQALSKQGTDTQPMEMGPPGRGGRGRGPMMAMQSLVMQNARKESVAWIIGTSLIFEAVCVALAAWFFCTRDF